VESQPVFADPSGRRRRVMRYAGLGLTAVLAVCLGAVVVAMTGGPRAPLTQWAAPRPRVAATHAVTPGHAPQRSPDQAIPPLPGSRPGGVTPGASHDAAPLPSAGQSPQPTAPATLSAGSAPTSPAGQSSPTSPAGRALPTNPAGQTPPGRAKPPNPRKPSPAV